MKKLRIRIVEFVQKAEGKWKSLPAKQQRSLTKIFFTAYAMLTILTVIHLWSKGSKNRTILSVGHINNIPKEIKMQHQPIEDPANHSPYKTSP
ncbi:hypothetical protein [Chryseobacterium culicis]|uniref:Nitrogen regulatory IIA protein n=1 Tax=Chryseobacterium culicis TaxID=680127 RepID=A0A1H6IGT1_CHRCI|nr:hypothetical protein [Chryseobacterium culicis]SEH48004.1 hypothetical protein SAMN05421593_4550 [Chryseobacterium culicis]